MNHKNSWAEMMARDAWAVYHSLNCAKREHGQVASRHLQDAEDMAVWLRLHRELYDMTVIRRQQ